jgi:hypothetical protein
MCVIKCHWMHIYIVMRAIMHGKNYLRPFIDYTCTCPSSVTLFPNVACALLTSALQPAHTNLSSLSAEPAFDCLELATPPGHIYVRVYTRTHTRTHTHPYQRHHNVQKLRAGQRAHTHEQTYVYVYVNIRMDSSAPDTAKPSTR